MIKKIGFQLLQDDLWKPQLLIITPTDPPEFGILSAVASSRPVGIGRARTAPR